MQIASPRRPGQNSDGDSDIDAEFAIEPSFQQLTAAAEAAGWSGDEVAVALHNLALAYVASRRANEATDAAIQAAIAWRWVRDEEQRSLLPSQGRCPIT